MPEVQERVWLLTSETGIPTECELLQTRDGQFQITILVKGSAATCEVYRSELQARTRASELKRALVVRGWSDDSGAATPA
jgi:hypothetical protein